ncbi:MAG: hypothetical protein QM723_38890 [Myxococcaceae bacterium]
MEGLPLTLTQLQLVLQAVELGRASALARQLESVRQKTRSLLENAPNAAMLGEATADYVTLCGAIATELASRSDVASMLSTAHTALNVELARLSRKFEGAEGSSAIAVAIKVIDSFFEASAKIWVQVLTDGKLAELKQALGETQGVNWSDPALGVLRGLLLVSALGESSRPANSLTDHAEWAYLELMQGVDAFSSLEGAPLLTPFPSERGPERAAQTLKYALEVRQRAPAELVRAIESAHVRNF